MSEYRVILDTSSLTQFLDNFAKGISKDLQEGIEGLTKQTSNHIKEKAQEKLHSFREEYIKNVSIVQVNNYMWEISLHPDATWIEEGGGAWDMKPGLLKGGEDGVNGRYRIVPMNQNKLPNQMSSGRDSNVDAASTFNKKGKYQGAGFEYNERKRVHAELSRLGISASQYKKLEIDPKTGSPRIGKIASFDLPGHPPGNGNTALLARVNVYQREAEIFDKKTKKMKTVVQRQVTTFRTVTEHQDGKWIHPSVTGLKLFEEAKSWAENQWVTEWLPKIMQKYQGR
jgi:hypothetical protein